MFKINVKNERLFMTSGVNEIVKSKPENFDLLKDIIVRFINCDFDSCMPSEDYELNMYAVKTECGRVLAPYFLDDVKVWVIHEFAGEESVTTVLLPEEY